METNPHWMPQPVVPRPALEPSDAPAPPVGDDGLSGESPFGAQRKPLLKRIGSGVAVVGALIAKFLAQFKALLLLLPKLKLLASAGSALVSVAAWSLFFGWTFAIGFVVLLFVHEMGHVIALRREGIKASLPMFIPFMGAVITAKSLGENALAEARVGLAGPILGSAGAAACLIVAEATNSRFFKALAYIGFFLNLINLLPVLPLDGGRAMAAMAPWMWFVGFAALIPVAVIFPGPIVFLIIIFGGREVWVRWQKRKTRSLEQAAYYRVSKRNRLLVAGVYIGLIVLLAVGMHAAYLPRSLG